MKLKSFNFFTIYLFIISSVFSQNNQYEVVPVSDSINSPYDEQAPVLNSEGNILYFTRSKHPDNLGGKKDEGDIWYAEKDDNGNWSTPKNIGEPLNSKYYNAVIGVDGNAIYLVGHYVPTNRRPSTRGVSVSFYQNGSWSFPQPVDIPYFDNYSDHQSACLSYDGRIMVHAIETYNTRGAEDLYVSFRKTDGSWTDVKNLGSAINTDYQEKTPFLAADNRTLIFSSNGMGGEGSMDLFKTERLDDSWKNWTEPENLGNVINTTGRELYYFVMPGSDEAIFCSTQNSDGYGDVKYYRLKPEEIIEPVETVIMEQDTVIREFIVEEDMLVLRGKIFNAVNNEPIGAEISVFLDENTEIADLESDTATGEFQLEIASRNNFLFRVSAKGFMNVEDRIRAGDTEENLVLRNYYLEPLAVGKTFKLNNVHFHRATDNLVDSAYAELDNVYRMMENNPGIAIELSGHTDNQGSARKNLALSQARVEVVKQYLIDKGIDPGRISGKGYGGSQPVASNRTEETRRLNRRVEFKVIRAGEADQ